MKQPQGQFWKGFQIPMDRLTDWLTDNGLIYIQADMFYDIKKDPSNSRDFFFSKIMQPNGEGSD